jgi:hypothetical protein
MLARLARHTLISTAERCSIQGCSVASCDDILEGSASWDHGQHVLDVGHHDVQQVGAFRRQRLPVYPNPSLTATQVHPTTIQHEVWPTALSVYKKL